MLGEAWRRLEIACARAGPTSSPQFLPGANELHVFGAGVDWLSPARRRGPQRRSHAPAEISLGSCRCRGLSLPRFAAGCARASEGDARTIIVWSRPAASDLGAFGRPTSRSNARAGLPSGAARLQGATPFADCASRAFARGGNLLHDQRRVGRAGRASSQQEGSRPDNRRCWDRVSSPARLLGTSLCAVGDARSSAETGREGALDLRTLNHPAFLHNVPPTTFFALSTVYLGKGGLCRARKPVEAAANLLPADAGRRCG